LRLNEATKSPDNLRSALLKGNSRPTTNITTVTAYWKLGKSKHSDDDYKRWTSFFLQSIGPNLVVFCAPGSKQSILQMRPEKYRSTTLIIDAYEEPRDLPCLRAYINEYLNKQNDLDPEKWRHSGDLYTVWNAKVCMVRDVMYVDPFNSELFQWIDMGSFRSRSFPDWPNMERVKSVFSGQIRNGKNEQPQILFEQMFRPNQFDFEAARNLQLLHKDVVAGGFFTGTRSGISWFFDVFWCLHDYFLFQNLFVGKEQNIMATTVLGSFNYTGIWFVPTSVRDANLAESNLAARNISRPSDQSSNTMQTSFCGDPWFYYHLFFADPLQVGTCSVFKIYKPGDFI
jgi:hypothetical protein